jgi:hypothetical protein
MQWQFDHFTMHMAVEASQCFQSHHVRERHGVCFPRGAITSAPDPPLVVDPVRGASALASGLSVLGAASRADASRANVTSRVMRTPCERGGRDRPVTPPLVIDSAHGASARASLAPCLHSCGPDGASSADVSTADVSPA